MLSSSDGFPLRANGSCGDFSSCGPTEAPFFACCPSSSSCIQGYNAACCPNSTRLLPPELCSRADTETANNCTDTLSASPRCANQTWTLCSNNGFFCCLPGYQCYSKGDTDGCGEPGYVLKEGESPVSTFSQIPPELRTSPISF